MSKAEELSRQYVLPLLDKDYEKYGKVKQMSLSKFDGYDIMSAYEEGYHQAMKEAIKEVCKWLNVNADKYIINTTPSCPDADFSAVLGNKCVEDLKKHLEDKV